jgi:heat shock protein HslJ
MKRSAVLIGCALLFAVLVCGCTTPSPAQPPATPALPVTTVSQVPAAEPGFLGNWMLTMMTIKEGSVVIRPTTDITLAFNADGTLTGYGGCNNYFGSYTLTGTTTMFGDGITVSPLASTKKYCEINGQQETTYLAILQDTMAYAVNSNQLTLTDKSNNVLVYKVPSPLLKTTM